MPAKPTIRDRVGRLFLCIGMMCIVSEAKAAFTIPENDGFLTDTVGIITAEQDGEIERILIDYRTETSNEIAVLILDALEGADMAETAVAILRKWGVGQKDKNNGILILIVYGEKKIFIATGYGLEGAVPDSIAKRIIENDILPRFREGAYFEGILSGVQALERSIGGEYVNSTEKAADFSWLPTTFLIVLFIVVNVLRFFGTIFARTKSWWLGGLIGFLVGVPISLLLSMWTPFIMVTLAGFIFDYFVSKYGWKPRYRRSQSTFWSGGGGRGGFGGSSGGGGFGGGSSGGGGAGGNW